MNQKEHPLYSVFTNMRTRCNNPNHPSFRYYGARGISVCDRWSQFWNFVEDMGDRPDGHELDRIDNDGDYCPENCKWSSKSDQMKNRRKYYNPKIRGEKNVRCKITDEQVREMRRLKAQGLTNQAISEQYGVARSTVEGITNGSKRKYVL